MKVDELKWLIDADFGTDPDPPSYALGFAVFFFQPGSIAGIAGPSRLIAGSVSVRLRFPKTSTVQSSFARVMALYRRRRLKAGDHFSFLKAQKTNTWSGARPERLSSWSQIEALESCKV
jgi:hypothetical protein